MRRAFVMLRPVGGNNRKTVSSAVQVVKPRAGRGGESSWSGNSSTQLEV